MATIVKNKYKCPPAIWKKMRTDKARKIYNDVMAQTLKNQSIVIPPKMPVIFWEHWYTICHNFAYFAVCAYQNEPLRKGDEVVDIDLKTGAKIRTRKVA